MIIQLARIEKSGRRRTQGADTLDVPWRKTPFTRRREVLLPVSEPPHQARPIRSESRALGRIDCAGTPLAQRTHDRSQGQRRKHRRREGCSVRKINMTISLAFLAPDLVKAAIDGRLPHGMGVARLADLPAEWSRQRQMLGLPVVATTSGPVFIQEQSASGKRIPRPETNPQNRRQARRFRETETRRTRPANWRAN